MQLSTYIRAGFALFCAALALVPAAAARPQGTALSRSERSLLAFVNQARTSNGLRPLRLDVALARVARSYSATLLQTGQFTHGDFAGRMARSGARGPRFGENLAWGTGSYGSPRTVVANWLRSPGHRANLLRPGWTRVGIGVARGTYQGYPGATVVTANFAGS